jgi:hypothetical protein
MSDACGSCRFWLPVGGEGLCRRKPPTPIQMPATDDRPAGVASIFPRMTPEGWCGEFKRVVR